MFMINGMPNAWHIEKGGDSFTVVNSMGNVSLTVDKAEIERIQELPSANERSIINKDIYPDTGLIVRFDDKTMIPSAISTGEKRKNTILAAISIALRKGYYFTSVYNNGAMIYSRYFDRHDKIEFIANLSKSRGKREFYPSIQVTAVNPGRNTFLTYSIRYSEEKQTVTVYTKQGNIDSIPEFGEKGYVNIRDFVKETLEAGKVVLPRFFPSSPSNNILVDEINLIHLKDVIAEHKNWRATNQYNIDTDMTRENLEKYVSDGYKAVTIYYGGDIDVKNFKEENYSGNEVIKDALELFDTVYLIDYSGIVYKLMVDGHLRVSE